MYLKEGVGLVVRVVGSVTPCWVEADRECSVEHQDSHRPRPTHDKEIYVDIS